MLSKKSYNLCFINFVEIIIMRIIRLLIGYFVIGSLSYMLLACTKLASDFDDKSSISEIFAGANEAYEKGDFSRSAEIFLKVEEYFPYSDESREALVKAIDAYHKGAKFLELRTVSKRFVELYPESENAPYAKYMVGMSYFEQIIDVERDQGATRDSMREFYELNELYPNNKYQELARKNIKIAKNQLAGQEMSVGRYYLKKGNPFSALKRFQTVMHDHRDTPFYPESLYRMLETYLVLGVDGQALDTFNSLRQKFPSSKWTTLASVKIRESGLRDK